MSCRGQKDQVKRTHLEQVPIALPLLLQPFQHARRTLVPLLHNLVQREYSIGTHRLHTPVCFFKLITPLPLFTDGAGKPEGVDRLFYAWVRIKGTDIVNLEKLEWQALECEL